MWQNPRQFWMSPREKQNQLGQMPMWTEHLMEKPRVSLHMACQKPLESYIGKSQKCLTLSHILIFYKNVICALVISNFYMRYGINALAEQLQSLISIVDIHQAEQAAVCSVASQEQLNVEVLCWKFTANIMELEKIQNNLQKLFENGDWPNCLVGPTWNLTLPFEGATRGGILMERSLLAGGTSREASPAMFALGGLQLKKGGGEIILVPV